MRVFIYWNLHRSCWSIKALSGVNKGRVMYHASRWEVAQATFKVSEAGRQRVLRENRKNVHAGVVGELRSWVDLDGDQGGVGEPWQRGELLNALAVTYNPRKGPTFVTCCAVPSAALAADRVNADGRAVLAWGVR